MSAYIIRGLLLLDLFIFIFTWTWTQCSLYIDQQYSEKGTAGLLIGVNLIAHIIGGNYRTCMLFLVTLTGKNLPYMYHSLTYIVSRCMHIIHLYNTTGVDLHPVSGTHETNENPFDVKPYNMHTHRLPTNFIHTTSTTTSLPHTHIYDTPPTTRRSMHHGKISVLHDLLTPKTRLSRTAMDTFSRTAFESSTRCLSIRAWGRSLSPILLDIPLNNTSNVWILAQFSALDDSTWNNSQGRDRHILLSRPQNRKLFTIDGRFGRVYLLRG